MPDDVFTMTKKIGDQMPYRSVHGIYGHMYGEMLELNDEIDKMYEGRPFGDDGIEGEAVDVILCALDVIQQVNPNFSEEDFKALCQKKLDKWKSKYS